MNADAQLEKAVALIDEQIASALRTTYKFRERWSGEKLRRRIGGFATLIQPSQEQVEYDFFNEFIEFSVRNDMVNPILESLFALYGIDAIWPRGSTVFWLNNEKHERANPIEFLISTNCETVGYRYTIPDPITAMEVDSWGISRIVVIDWSAAETEELKRRSEELCVEGSDSVFQISSSGFFKKFFPEALYDEFVYRIRDAVARVEDIIGLQAIPSLSMPRLAPFRAPLIDEIHRTVDGFPESTYTVKSNHATFRLADEDQIVLNKAFFDDGLGHCLVGTKGFARCLTTSEYLRRSFLRGGEFDYTSIVCGYIKAVEQLSYELMLATLGTPGSENLFIATPSKGKGAIEYRRPFDWSKKTRHVQFVESNRERFSTNLVSLANLLHDNETAWRISDEGRHFVLLKIRDFAGKDRNGYFHKDNFTDLGEVNRIRQDAIALLYYLLGGYAIPGSKEKALETLGLKHVSYSEMYMKLAEIPLTDFVLEFEGLNPVKAVRPFEQPVIEYDDYGLVSSKIFFVRVDSYRGARERELTEAVSKDDLIVVDRDNMPSRVFFVKRSGERVQVW